MFENLKRPKGCGWSVASIYGVDLRDTDLGCSNRYYWWYIDTSIVCAHCSTTELRQQFRQLKREKNRVGRNWYPLCGRPIEPTNSECKFDSLKWSAEFIKVSESSQLISGYFCRTSLSPIIIKASACVDMPALSLCGESLRPDAASSHCAKTF